MKHALLSALLFSACTAAAQTTATTLQNPVSPELPAAVPLQIAPRVGITTELQLTLQDVIRAVLSSNRDVELANISRQVAKLNLKAARGYFDPVLGGNGYALRQVTPVASSLGGAINGAVTQKEIFANPQITGNSPWLGTAYKLDFSSARIDSNNTFNSLNPTYPTTANFQLTQPLWGGLRFDQNRERIAVARRNVNQTEEQFRQRVIDSATQAIRAYWELDYALKNLDVQIEAVHLAEQQDASNRRQVAQGTQAPVDVIQTQTQMSTYQQNVFNAQQQVTQAENTLKTLMLPDRNDPLWSAALKTSTNLNDEGAPVPTLEQALADALTQRPDLKAAQIGVQLSQVQARLATEQARPQVDLVVQAGAQGLAGRVVTQTSDPFGSLFGPLFTRVDELSSLAGLPPLSTAGLGSSSNAVPSFFVGGYGQSLQGLRDLRFPTVQVGLRISIPLGNRTARAEANIASENTRQSLVQQQQREMTAVSEVRNSLQQLVNSDLVLTASHRSVQLSQQQYESEQRQFKAGTSSVFLVLQRQTELINARLREIRATADRGEAEADFDRATGDTLQHQHIDLVSKPVKRQ